MQETQRLHELEAMKRQINSNEICYDFQRIIFFRVEEDFLRKRAPEKANLRNQLRLHLKASTENEEYRSLPLILNDRYENQQSPQQQRVPDINNNIFCRAEPDGAVSPTQDFFDNLEKLNHSSLLSNRPIRCFDFDGNEIENEVKTSNIPCSY